MTSEQPCGWYPCTLQKGHDGGCSPPSVEQPSSKTVVDELRREAEADRHKFNDDYLYPAILMRRAADEIERLRGELRTYLPLARGQLNAIYHRSTDSELIANAAARLHELTALEKSL